MDIKIKRLVGGWDLGYALQKHTLSSSYVGDDQWGHPRFETVRSEPGEALYQLKYRNDQSQIDPLALELKDVLLPLFGKVDLIVPMPASTMRVRQPVIELAKSLGKIANIPVFENLVIRASLGAGSTPLKDLNSRTEKDEALSGKFTINDGIGGEGKWNALLLDDLFDTGATMEAATQALRTYRKINKIYAATITWK